MNCAMLHQCVVEICEEAQRNEMLATIFNESCPQIKSKATPRSCGGESPNKKQQQWSLAFHFSYVYTRMLKLIFCVKHSNFKQQHGAYIKYSLSRYHQTSIWTSSVSFISLFVVSYTVYESSFCFCDKNSTCSPIKSYIFLIPTSLWQ